MSQEFNKKYNTNISDIQIKNKIKYLKKMYSKVILDKLIIITYV